MRGRRRRSSWQISLGVIGGNRVETGRTLHSARDVDVYSFILPSTGGSADLIRITGADVNSLVLTIRRAAGPSLLIQRIRWSAEPLPRRLPCRNLRVSRSPRATGVQPSRFPTLRIDRPGTCRRRVRRHQPCSDAPVGEQPVHRHGDDHQRRIIRVWSNLRVGNDRSRGTTAVLHAAAIQTLAAGASIEVTRPSIWHM
jgi:hypothetical protein